MRIGDRRCGVKATTEGMEWGPHLKKGGLCGVQLSVALNLQEQTQNIY